MSYREYERKAAVGAPAETVTPAHEPPASPLHPRAEAPERPARLN